MAHQTSAAIARRKSRNAPRPVAADGEGRVIARLASGPVVATLAGPVTVDAAGHSRADVSVCGVVRRGARVTAYSAAGMDTAREGEGHEQKGREAEGKGARHGDR